MVKKLLLTLFIFFLFINNSFAVFTSKELQIINETTWDWSYTSVDANIWDTLTLYVAWVSDVNANNLWVHYIWDNLVYTSELFHWDVDLYRNWNLRVENISNYNYWFDFIVNSWDRARNNRYYEMYSISFTIDSDFCWTDMPSFNAEWIHDLTWTWSDLIWSVTANVLNSPVCNPWSWTWQIFFSNPILFDDLDLDSFDYETSVIQYPDWTYWVDNTKQLSDITKILYQLLIVSLVFYWFMMLWINYSFINDLLWKK